MNLLDARVRETKSKGDVRSLRLKGNIPAKSTVAVTKMRKSQYQQKHSKS